MQRKFVLRSFDGNFHSPLVTCITSMGIFLIPGSRVPGNAYIICNWARGFILQEAGQKERNKVRRILLFSEKLFRVRNFLGLIHSFISLGSDSCSRLFVLLSTK